MGSSSNRYAPRLPQQETKSSTKLHALTDPILGPENLLKTGFAQKGLPSIYIYICMYIYIYSYLTSTINMNIFNYIYIFSNTFHSPHSVTNLICWGESSWKIHTKSLEKTRESCTGSNKTSRENACFLAIRHIKWWKWMFFLKKNGKNTGKPSKITKQGFPNLFPAHVFGNQTMGSSSIFQQRSAMLDDPINPIHIQQNLMKGPFKSHYETPFISMKSQFISII